LKRHVARTVRDGALAAEIASRIAVGAKPGEALAVARLAACLLPRHAQRRRMALARGTARLRRRAMRALRLRSVAFIALVIIRIALGITGISLVRVLLRISLAALGIRSGIAKLTTVVARISIIPILLAATVRGRLGDRRYPCQQQETGAIQ